MKEESAEQLKAKALRYIVENYGDDLVKEDPDAAALIMEVFIDAYNLDRPTPAVGTKTAEELANEYAENLDPNSTGKQMMDAYKAFLAGYHAQFTSSAKSGEVEEADLAEAAVRGFNDRLGTDKDGAYFHGFYDGSNWQQQKQAETISRLRGALAQILAYEYLPSISTPFDLAKEALK